MDRWDHRSFLKISSMRRNEPEAPVIPMIARFLSKGRAHCHFDYREEVGLGDAAMLPFILFICRRVEANPITDFDCQMRA
jgi:hypothetical protein